MLTISMLYFRVVASTVASQKLLFLPVRCGWDAKEVTTDGRNCTFILLPD